MKKLTLVILALTISLNASAKESWLGELSRLASDRASQPPTGQSIEVGFSPDEGAEKLVIKTINTANHEIRLLAYSFTSAPITQALLAAKHRGVDVEMVVDYKNNVREDHSGKARHALAALVYAGIRVRTISIYPNI